MYSSFRGTLPPDSAWEVCLLLAQLLRYYHLGGRERTSSFNHAETQGPEERSHTLSLPLPYLFRSFFIPVSGGVYFFCLSCLLCWGGKRRINNVLKAGASAFLEFSL